MSTTRNSSALPAACRALVPRGVVVQLLRRVRVDTRRRAAWAERTRRTLRALGISLRARRACAAA